MSASRSQWEWQLVFEGELYMESLADNVSPHVRELEEAEKEAIELDLPFPLGVFLPVRKPTRPHRESCKFNTPTIDFRSRLFPNPK